ncbi:uncharacterized protein KY384_006773 [Bacidia gigantensis]|uniref:uncharacterized protein n=1 Tax=Bacidia gigantensis TaxID=2732470 RepID=UPI001D0579F5|nr:uncharacterized protein KY384_006773 [Bacidia gigantensis]KAG8527857.1 hypothetical protein KY384_006773 [Bacidia gigantensis]
MSNSLGIEAAEATDSMAAQDNANFSLPRPIPRPTRPYPKRVSYLASQRESQVGDKRDSQISNNRDSQIGLSKMHSEVSNKRASRMSLSRLNSAVSSKRASSRMNFEERNSQLDLIDVDSGRTYRELFYALEHLPSGPSINFNLPRDAADYLANISEKDLLNQDAQAKLEGREQRQLSVIDDSSSEEVEKAEPPPPNPWMDPKSFPDGGTQAWLTVAGSAACLFVSFGWINAIGIFQEYYQSHQLKQYTPSVVAWIPALQRGMFIPFTFIVVEALAHGMSNRMANYLVPILNGASIIGRTVPNALADKVGRFNVMIVMSSFTTILILALWLPATSNVPIILFAALFGIGSGAGVGLTPALCAQVSPIQEIGVRTGTAFTISAFAALTGSPIGGQIIGSTGKDYQAGFRYAIAFGGASCAIGTCLFIVTRLALAGTKITKI